MMKYVKPVAGVVDSVVEGVYMASGDNKIKCRFGREDYNPGSDQCQGCSASGGASNDGTGLFKEDFNGCPDNMPQKK